MSAHFTKAWGIIAAAVALALLAALWYLDTPRLFPLEAADEPIAWSLPASSQTASSTKELLADIAGLGKRLSAGEAPRDELENAIANDYLLLGQGRAAYEAYSAAVAASSTNALIYYNLGALFTRLHATSTAIAAYAKAVALAPDQPFYQMAYTNAVQQR